MLFFYETLRLMGAQGVILIQSQVRDVFLASYCSSKVTGSRQHRNGAAFFPLIHCRLTGPKRITPIARAACF